MNRFQILKGQIPKAPKCAKCRDSGVIETGNNDLPCDCPAGDRAVFNVAGRGQMLGKDLKMTETKIPNPTSFVTDDEFWDNLRNSL